MSGMVAGGSTRPARAASPRSGAPAWVRRLLRACEGLDALRAARAAGGRVHLGVLREPHLSRVLSGTKTVEARFCRARRAPMGVVFAGDVVLLKRAGGAVLGWCMVDAVETFDLRENELAALRARFDRAMGRPGDAFWNAVSRADPQGVGAGRGPRFGTMIGLSGVRTLERPVACAKADRRAWVVLA